MSSPQDNPPPTAPHSAPVIRPWSSLLIRDYRLIFITILCANTANHMRNVASLYQVYHLSGSSVQLGLAGFFQAFPFIIFGLFGGVLADTLNRKKLIVITHSLNVLPGVALGALTLTGYIQVWHINALNVVASSLQVLGGPSRQAIIPGLVPQSYMLNAVTMATLMMQGTQLTAPVIAGFLIDFFGVQASYFADAALLVPSVISTLLIRASGRPQGKRRQISWRSLIEGFEFLWHTRIILSLFLLDFFAVLFGFFRPILPIFADDDLQSRRPRAGHALCRAGDRRVGRFGHAAGRRRYKTQRRAFDHRHARVRSEPGISRSVAMVLAGSASPSALLGISDAISVAMRRTVVQLLAPDNMRGRATSFLTVFAQTTNATGAVIAGAGAALLGAPNAALVGSVLCTLTIIGTCWAIPQLWHYRSDSA